MEYLPVNGSYKHSLARSLALWANDFPSSPSCVCPVLVTADLNAGTTFLVGFPLSHVPVHLRVLL